MVVLLLLLCAALVAGVLHLRALAAGRGGGRRGGEGGSAGPVRLLHPLPVGTATALVLIGTVSALQLTVAPVLLGALGRDVDRVAAGQWWRLGTALLVQDGGVAGTLSNLVWLALLGVVAERALGRRWFAAAFLVPALVAEVVALAWQPVGAGNSVAVLGLGGAVVALALVPDPRAVPAVVALAMVVVLLARQDIHGAAAATGVLVGLARRAMSGWGTGRHRRGGPA